MGFPRPYVGGEVCHPVPAQSKSHLFIDALNPQSVHGTGVRPQAPRSQRTAGVHAPGPMSVYIMCGEENS